MSIVTVASGITPGGTVGADGAPGATGPVSRSVVDAAATFTSIGAGAYQYVTAANSLVTIDANLNAPNGVFHFDPASAGAVTASLAVEASMATTVDPGTGELTVSICPVTDIATDGTLTLGAAITSVSVVTDPAAGSVYSEISALADAPAGDYAVIYEAGGAAFPTGNIALRHLVWCEPTS